MKATKHAGDPTSGAARVRHAGTTRGASAIGAGEMLTQLGTALSARLTRWSYRAIMALPRWYFIVQAIVVTRSYDTGLEAGLQLLAFTHAHRDALDPAEFDRNARHLYLFLLDMLDRLDEWDGYVSAWAQIRAHVPYTVTYTPPRPERAIQAAPYVVGREGDQLRLHFLWWTDDRKAMIERKVQARRGGRRLGNLMHHPQADLSDAERRRRLAWVTRLARAAAWGGSAGTTGSDIPDPPSSTRANDVTRLSTLEFTISIDESQLWRAVTRQAAQRRGEAAPDESRMGHRQSTGRPGDGDPARGPVCRHPDARAIQSHAVLRTTRRYDHDA